MIDGLYIVTTHYLCAAFVVERGHISLCAPILRRKIDYWKTVATGLGIDIHARKFDDATPAEDFNAEEWCDLYGAVERNRP